MKCWIGILLLPFICGVAAAQGSWDESLNKAGKAGYLSNLEKEVIFEMNKVRSNPAKYAEEVIKPMLKLFSDPNKAMVMVREDGVRIVTTEGSAAVKECIKVLSKAKPVAPLAPSKGLSLAARDHLNAQGPKGEMGHSSSAGKTPWERMDKHGARVGLAGENIDYGNNIARDIVISLLVDDGVPSRGHRTNILKEDFGVAGVACGLHSKYSDMCVIDYASGFTEKDSK